MSWCQGKYCVQLFYSVGVLVAQDDEEGGEGADMAAGDGAAADAAAASEAGSGDAAPMES